MFCTIHMLILHMDIHVRSDGRIGSYFFFLSFLSFLSVFSPSSFRFPMFRSRGMTTHLFGLFFGRVLKPPLAYVHG